MRKYFKQQICSPVISCKTINNKILYKKKEKKKKYPKHITSIKEELN